jgi:hypothetical protein
MHPDLWRAETTEHHPDLWAAVAAEHLKDLRVAADRERLATAAAPSATRKGPPWRRLVSLGERTSRRPRLIHHPSGSFMREEG